jgi:hypothetical protein
MGKSVDADNVFEMYKSGGVRQSYAKYVIAAQGDERDG